MKTYKVIASSISYFSLEIEAENEAEAWLEAKNSCGSDFKLDGDGDWIISEVIEQNQEVKQ